MTNKRKKLARTMTAKGMSYQAAINQLTRNVKQPRRDLRELLARDRRDGLYDGVQMSGTPIEKDPDQIAFIANAEGKGEGDLSRFVYGVQKPRHVVVPFVQYETEDKVRELILALFTSCGVWFDLPVTPPADLLTRLKSQVDGPLRALLADERYVRHAMDVAGDLPVYAGTLGPFVLGLGDPERVGVVAENSQGALAILVNHRQGAIGVARMESKPSAT